MQFLNKLERKFGRYAIPNLMTFLVFGMGLVFLLDTFTAMNPNLEFTLSDILYFDRNAVLQGQIWRIITFLFLPPSGSVLLIAFVLYFYWTIGTALEAQWGSFKFNVYYFTGAVLTIIGGIIVGYSTNYYLNLSLFLAFAAIFPNFEVMVFFLIPVKMKYLAVLDVFLITYDFIRYPIWSYRAAILISLANFLLFFGKDLFKNIFMFFRRRNYQNQNKVNWKDKNNHWWNDKK